VELTVAHQALLRRLVDCGYVLVAFPLYANAVGIRRDSLAALLVPVDESFLHILGQPSYLIDGNLSVRILQDGREWFVWKKKKIEATPERLGQLDAFSRELSDFLGGSRSDAQR
jgi:hypothetical protein